MYSERGLAHYYKRIAQVSAQMRQAAEQEHWQDFDGLQQECKQAIQALKKLDAEATASDPVVTPLRLRVLKQVLSDDAYIRDLTQPELKRTLYWRLAHKS